MKKMIILVAILSLVVAGIAYAGVVGSKHDVSTNYTTSQVCVFCHHPHGDTTTQNDLLWNINDSDASYPTYASTATTTTNVAGQTLTSTDAPQTMLCMGCHDGDGADNSYRKAAVEATDMSAVGTILNSYANLGETLIDDHPVGFQYPESGWTNFGDLAEAVAGGPSGNQVAGKYPVYGSTKTMECATCHDVHAGNTSASTELQFMRGDTATSTICTDCHTEK
jgi:nitrate/TMAO reductase-like tetraheme cytochrome c subunit